jgi:hypothetical protein
VRLASDLLPPLKEMITSPLFKEAIGNLDAMDISVRAAAWALTCMAHKLETSTAHSQYYARKTEVRRLLTAGWYPVAIFQSEPSGVIWEGVIMGYDLTHFELATLPRGTFIQVVDSLPELLALIVEAP